MLGSGVYAGFIRRYLAGIIDLGIVAGLGYAFSRAVPSGMNTGSAVFYLFGPLLMLPIIYYGACEGLTGGTPGKWIAGIRVINHMGDRPGLGRALARALAKGLTVATLGIGFAISAFTKKRRALHDMVSGTLVVSRHSIDANALTVDRTMPLIASIPILAVLMTGLMIGPFAVEYLQDRQQEAFRESLPLTIEEIGQRSPEQPLQEGFALDRLSHGIVQDGRPIRESALGYGGQAAGDLGGR